MVALARGDADAGDTGTSDLSPQTPPTSTSHIWAYGFPCSGSTGASRLGPRILRSDVRDLGEEPSRGRRTLSVKKIRRVQRVPVVLEPDEDGFSTAFLQVFLPPNHAILPLYEGQR